MTRREETWSWFSYKGNVIVWSMEIFVIMRVSTEKALAAYDSALRIDPEDADAWYDKGETLNKMGRHAEAAKCIATAIDLYCG